MIHTKLIIAGQTANDCLNLGSGRPKKGIDPIVGNRQNRILRLLAEDAPPSEVANGRPDGIIYLGGMAVDEPIGIRIG